MIHLYFRLTLIPLFIFTTALLLIRTQLYDDHELRQLLLPDGCTAPCFMGIRPGVTTVDEAKKILEASGWVKDIEVTDGTDETTGNAFTAIHWTWNSSRSQLLDLKHPGYLLSHEQGVHAAVESVYISTVLPMGLIHLFLQSPTFYEINTAMPDTRIKIPIGMAILYDTVQSRAYVGCPLKIREVWKHRADLSFYSKSPPDYQSVQPWDNQRIMRTIKFMCSYIP